MELNVQQITSSVAEWVGEDLQSDRLIAVDKQGGGTVGKAYDGAWYVTVYEGSLGNPVWESDELITGTPKTHAGAAEIALDFHSEDL